MSALRKKQDNYLTLVVDNDQIKDNASHLLIEDIQKGLFYYNSSTEASTMKAFREHLCFRHLFIENVNGENTIKYIESHTIGSLKQDLLALVDLKRQEYIKRNELRLEKARLNIN